MKLVVVSVVSDPTNPGFARLRDSCKYYGYDFYPIFHPWIGFKTKLIAVRSLIPQLRRLKTTHVLHTDGYDTIANRHANEIDPFLLDGCLISAELSQWPPIGIDNLFPTSPTEWRFPNSGGYLADIDYLEGYILDGIDREPMLSLEESGHQPIHRNDDQLWLSWKFLRDQARCRIDYQCQVFQTLAHTIDHSNKDGWSSRYDISQGYLINRITGTRPSFVHGNGQTSMSWIPSPK